MNEGGTEKRGSQDPDRAAIVMMTDFGRDSFYVGAMKAAVLAVDPGALVVDLTHGIRPFAIGEASFVLSLAFEWWREGTVFLVVVDPGVGGERKNVMVRSHNRWIVGPDNGLVSDVAERFGIDAVFAIEDEDVARVRRHGAAGRTFLGRDVFAPAAAFLALGGRPETIGRSVEGCRRLPLPPVEAVEGRVRGRARFVDDFGNVLTDISARHLGRAFGSAPLETVRVKAGAHEIRGVVECFSRGAEGELLAVLNSWDLIEISVNGGRADDRFPSGSPLVVEITSG